MDKFSYKYTNHIFILLKYDLNCHDNLFISFTYL